MHEAEATRWSLIVDAARGSVAEPSRVPYVESRDAWKLERRLDDPFEAGRTDM